MSWTLLTTILFYIFWKELRLKPMAYFRSCAVAGADPTRTYPAVHASVDKAVKK